MQPDIYLTARGEKYSNRSLAEKNIPAEYEIVQDGGGFYGQRRKELKVICPLCGGSHYETTDQYSPDKHAHPGMLRMVEPYRSYGWQQPPQDPSAGSGCLECCECGSALAPNGFLKVSNG